MKEHEQDSSNVLEQKAKIRSRYQGIQNPEMYAALRH